LSTHLSLQNEQCFLLLQTLAWRNQITACSSIVIRVFVPR
jgi:hypothetical protein